MITIKELIDKLTLWNIEITGTDYFDTVEGRSHAKARVFFIVDDKTYKFSKIEEIIPECDDEYIGGIDIHLETFDDRC